MNTRGEARRRENQIAHADRLIEGSPQGQSLAIEFHQQQMMTPQKGRGDDLIQEEETCQGLGVLVNTREGEKLLDQPRFSSHQITTGTPSSQTMEMPPIGYQQTDTTYGMGDTSKLVSPPPVGRENYNPGGMLLLRDLKGNGNLPMPVNAIEIYERNVTLADDKKGLSNIRKNIRYGIFPMYKFVNFENKEDKRATWDCVKNFRNEVGCSIPGDVVEALDVIDKGDMICALYWNTYKGEVLKTLSQTRSTIMSNMKKSIVPGKIYERLLFPVTTIRLLRSHENI